MERPNGDGTWTEKRITADEIREAIERRQVEFDKRAKAEAPRAWPDTFDAEQRENR